MYLDEAKQFLEKEYQEKYALAYTDYQKDFMNEKIRHSYQVLGAGKYILKHEEYFSGCLDGELDYYQAIVLLHDICRFYEILESEKGNLIDHGVYGAEYLVHTGLFSKADAILSIKHHGHLIEELYEDEVYKKLSRQKQAHVEQIAFLVRDADKLANFYLLSRDFEQIRRVFFVANSCINHHDKSVSPKVLADFLAHNSINKSDVQSFADQALMILAWIYDLNYRCSFVFLQKTNVLERLFMLFGEFWYKKDVKMFQQIINDFVLLKVKS